MKKQNLCISILALAILVGPLVSRGALADSQPGPRDFPRIDLEKSQAVTLFNKIGLKVRVTCGAEKRSDDGEINRLLALNDIALFEEAKTGIGGCKISLGAASGSWCKYYILLNGKGYPQGTGCTTDYYAPDGNAQKGEFFNAISFLREMIEAKVCVNRNP